MCEMVIGRGWGQGAQHAQSLQSWFAHIPGLKVIMPTTPHDVKGMLIAAVEDDDPVIVLEHRWLYNVRDEVPSGRYTVPLDRAKVAREGDDVTLVASSFMTLEALRAAELLEAEGVSAEVVDVRALNPLDAATVVASARKTRRLVVADTSWVQYGLAAEVLAVVAEAGVGLLAPPKRIGLAPCPSPSAPTLSAEYFPRATHVANAARATLGRPARDDEAGSEVRLDVPDPTFQGPF